MFKKFILGFAAIAMIAQPAFAGKFGGGGGFSSSRSSSFSSGSRSFSSGSAYRPNPTYARPAAPAPAPRFNAGAGYNYKPAQTQVVSRPAYNGGYNGYHAAPVVQHNYYGGGAGGGGGFASSFGGAFTGSMLGNMMFGNHNQTPVYVNNGGGQYAPQQMQPAPQDNGPGFFGMIFWGFVNLLTLIAIVAALIWIVVKIRNYIRKN